VQGEKVKGNLYYPCVFHLAVYTSSNFDLACPKIPPEGKLQRETLNTEISICERGEKWTKNT
jgi:hypothetical protein